MSDLEEYILSKGLHKNQAISRKTILHAADDAQGFNSSRQVLYVERKDSSSLSTAIV